MPPNARFGALTSASSSSFSVAKLKVVDPRDFRAASLSRPPRVNENAPGAGLEFSLVVWAPIDPIPKENAGLASRTGLPDIVAELPNTRDGADPRVPWPSVAVFGAPKENVGFGTSLFSFPSLVVLSNEKDGFDASLLPLVDPPNVKDGCGATEASDFFSPLGKPKAKPDFGGSCGTFFSDPSNRGAADFETSGSRLVVAEDCAVAAPPNENVGREFVSFSELNVPENPPIDDFVPSAASDVDFVLADPNEKPDDAGGFAACSTCPRFRSPSKTSSTFGWYAAAAEALSLLRKAKAALGPTGTSFCF